MRRRSLALLVMAVFSVVGCNPSTEVSAADAEKNKQAFSQESYEKAMIKAGKGDELAAEKARNAARNQGGAPQEEGQH